MIRHIRETVARRRGVELEPGFTLIELLIVIVVLGILAATVIFALTGITGQSAQAACQSDAKTYEIAVSAYENSPENPSNAVPTTTNQLLADSNGGPFLHAAANNTAYIVALNGDSVTDNTTGVNNTAAGTSHPRWSSGSGYGLGVGWRSRPRAGGLRQRDLHHGVQRLRAVGQSWQK